MYFSGACCDKLQVHSKEKEAFSHSKYVGDFLFQETPEGDPVICNEAAVFKHTNGKLFLYRNKDGDWVVGKNISQTEKISKSILSIVRRSRWKQQEGDLPAEPGPGPLILHPGVSLSGEGSPGHHHHLWKY